MNVVLNKAEGLFFAFILCCKHQLTAELTVFYFYFWTDFKDRDVIKSRGKVMERQFLYSFSCCNQQNSVCP